MNRPDGITLLSILHFVTAGICLLGVCALIVVPFIVSAATQGEPDADLAVQIVSIVMIAGIAFLILWGAANAAIGWGLWRMLPWARLGAIVLSVVRLINIPIGTVIGGLSLWYLFTPEAQAAFEPASTLAEG